MSLRALLWTAAAVAIAGSPSAPSAAAAPEEEASVQPLAVRVAYSPKIRRLPAWSSQLDCAFARAGGVLEEAVGRGLTLHSRLPWLGADVGRSPRELRRALLDEVEREGADLVVGIAVHVRPPAPAERPEGVLAPPELDFSRDEGLASYTEGYIAVDVRPTEICDGYRLLAHEIGHVFGGIHRRGKRLLMATSGNGVTVDPLNAELFALHRERRFGAGRAPLAGDDLRAMWRLANADVEHPQTWLVVGMLAARMGQPEAAARNHQRALDLDPDYLPALVQLGHARFQLGELEQATVLYRKALELRADDGLVANNLAAAYYGLGAADQALPYLVRALALGHTVHPQLIAEVEKATGRRVRRARE